MYREKMQHRCVLNTYKNMRRHQKVKEPQQTFNSQKVEVLGASMALQA